MDATAVVAGSHTSGFCRLGDAIAHVAQQRADTLAPLTLASLVLGRSALGSESSLLDLLRPKRLGLTPPAVTFSRDSRRKLRDELAGRSTLDEPAQVGHRAAHTLGLQPAGEFVEQGLCSDGVAASAGGKDSQQLRNGLLLGQQQAFRKDQAFTTTTTTANSTAITPRVAVWWLNQQRCRGLWWL
jgi:hypothetical protein